MAYARLLPNSAVERKRKELTFSLLIYDLTALILVNALPQPWGLWLG